MNKLVLAALAAFAFPSIAYAADPAPAPEKECCCKKKEQDKDCCAGMKEDAPHDMQGKDAKPAEHDKH